MIEQSPFQPRKGFDEDELSALSASIRTHGILQPLVVRQVGDRFQLVAGERRLRAARAAGLASVPVTVVNFNDQDASEAALIENIQRADLNAIEKVQGFKDYLDRYHMTHEQLATCLGLARPTITNLVALLELPGELQDAVRVGQLTTGHAKILKGITDPARQVQLSKEIIARGLSVHATEAFVKQQAAEKQAAESHAAGARRQAGGRKDQPRRGRRGRAAQEARRAFGDQGEGQGQGTDHPDVRVERRLRAHGGSAAAVIRSSRRAGRSAVRRAHRIWVPEVVGSNPTAPISPFARLPKGRRDGRESAMADPIQANGFDADRTRRLLAVACDSIQEFEAELNQLRGEARRLRDALTAIHSSRGWSLSSATTVCGTRCSGRAAVLYSFVRWATRRTRRPAPPAGSTPYLQWIERREPHAFADWPPAPAPPGETPAHSFPSCRRRPRFGGVRLVGPGSKRSELGVVDRIL